MSPKDIQPAIDMLRAHHAIDNPATIEQMAAACGIDVEKKGSYREVLDLAEALAASPDVVRVRVRDEWQYHAPAAPDPLRAIVDAPVLGSWTTEDALWQKVAPRVPAGREQEARALVAERVREHNASLE